MTATLASIFRKYDIRGIFGKTLNVNIAKRIGQVFGKIAIAKQQKSVIVGRDGRISGQELITALIIGLQSVGIKVIDLGIIITPMLYFATHFLDTQSGIMVTGSHNPPNYNGFKIVLAGETIHSDAIQRLYKNMLKNISLSSFIGSYHTYDIREAYIKHIINHTHLVRPIKIVIDCGNGVAGAFAGELYRALGCKVTELFCEVNGTFPNHHPDPSRPENLQDLIRCLQQTDNEIGLAFDGDGDRLGIVAKNGQIIFPDRQLMLFAADVLKRHPGQKILYDIKCTRHLASWINAYGGKPLMWQTGHSLIKSKMREIKAPLGGEMSGHIFFKDRWYGFDDGLYTGVRLLELLSYEKDSTMQLSTLPQSISTPELKLMLQEGENFLLLKHLQQEALFDDAQQIITIDGLRIEYADGFGLIRASNTTTDIILRFEAETQQALLYIQEKFKCMILSVRQNIQLPF